MKMPEMIPSGNNEGESSNLSKNEKALIRLRVINSKRSSHVSSLGGSDSDRKPFRN